MNLQPQSIFDELKQGGKRITPTLRAILNMFFTDHTLLSVPQIQTQLQAQGIKVNKTTVYRELQYLVNKHLLTEVSITPGVTHYESARQPHHHHLICNNCGRASQVFTSSIEPYLHDLITKVSKTGFVVHNHTLEFYGLCRQCN